MCGIFGFSYLSDEVDIKEEVRLGIRHVLTMLAIKNESRGDDSYGFAFCGDSKNVNTLKNVGSIHNIFSSDDYLNYLLPSKPERRIILGHTRAATHGTINIVNAHPIIAGKITGIHNGIISFDNEEIKKFTNKRFYSKFIDSHNDFSDTRIFFELVNNIGLKKALLCSRGGINTAFINANSKHILHLTKINNPLYCVFSKENSIFLFSSEKNHILESIHLCLNKTPFYELEINSNNAIIHINTLTGEIKEEKAIIGAYKYQIGGRFSRSDYSNSLFDFSDNRTFYHHDDSYRNRYNCYTPSRDPDEGEKNIIDKTDDIRYVEFYDKKDNFKLRLMDMYNSTKCVPKIEIDKYKFLINKYGSKVLKNPTIDSAYSPNQKVIKSLIGAPHTIMNNLFDSCEYQTCEVCYGSFEKTKKGQEVKFRIYSSNNGSAYEVCELCHTVVEKMISEEIQKTDDENSKVQ